MEATILVLSPNLSLEGQKNVEVPGGSAVKNPLAMQELKESGFDPWVRKIP